MAKKKQQIKVTLVRSPIGFQPKHRETVRGLGLKRIRQSVVLEDTPSVRGMVNKIDYMVRVEEV
jgi:large subunit ribosomal protein L30